MNIANEGPAFVIPVATLIAMCKESNGGNWETFGILNPEDIGVPFKDWPIGTGKPDDLAFSLRDIWDEAEEQYPDLLPEELEKLKLFFELEEESLSFYVLTDEMIREIEGMGRH